MIRVREAIVVEGKYDRIRLSSVIDGLILETGGFRIFKDRKKMEFLRRLAKVRGLLILTDSDSAGFLIRHYLSGSIPSSQLKNAYIPDIFGKEKRKRKPSREGKLGVEGIPESAILEALRRAGANCGECRPAGERKITRTDLYLAGFSGGEGSARRRRALLKKLNLPEHLSAPSLPGVLNSFLSFRQFQDLADSLNKTDAGMGSEESGEDEYGKEGVSHAERRNS